MYDILEKIYREFYDMFGFDSFHMGDSQFHIDCWNTSSEITDFMENDVRLKDRDQQGKEIHKLTTIITHVYITYLQPSSVYGATSIRSPVTD